MSRYQSLTDSEKRTIRIGGIVLAVFFVLFAGFQAWKYFDQKRADYHALIQQAKALRDQVRPYQDRVLVVQKLMDDFHLDPARLQRISVVSDASAAIQKSARDGGLQLGPIRETPTRGSGKTLATVQLESSGSVSAALSFLAGLNTIGYPLIVDSVQFSADNRPGQVKMNLTIIVLDFDHEAAPKEVPHA